MILKKHPILVATVLAVIAIAAIGFLIVDRHLANKRSGLSRIVRSWKGEYFVRQKANDLADALRSAPALAQLQPWALETMTQFRLGQVRTNGGNSLFWADNAVTLAPEETPEFIKKKLGETDKLGNVWPEILIVLSKGQPDYIVIRFGTWGIAVGPPEYLLSFNPSGTNEIAPGVYTYFNEE